MSPYRQNSPYGIEPLAKHHDRTAFSCGSTPLDTYLRKHANQDAKRHLAAPFVLIEEEEPKVIGYYTLSQMSINMGSLPPPIIKKLPKYPLIPATLLGRLAVDRRHQGKGLGELLLLDALHRSWSLSDKIAAFSVVVDAKDENAEVFYKRYEFESFPDHPQRLFILTAKLDKLFSEPNDHSSY